MSDILLSALVTAHNEERRLGDCLETLRLSLIHI